jgi:hypothetical protein
MKAFPQLDMDLPFTSSNFDEQRAELVGFQLARHGVANRQCGRNFIHLGGYVNF